MKSIISYILSIVGLLIILGSTKIFEIVSKYSTVKLPMIIILGAGFILIGIVTLLNPSEKRTKVTQSSEEVPIYIGEGKNRKIVGYRKAQN
jgi:predicted phage tail protein